MKFRNLLFLFFLTACSGQAENFEGHYVLDDQQTCQIPISITLKGEAFAIFETDSRGQEKSHLKLIDKVEASVIKDEENSYVKMNQIERLYQDDVITIQNEGNAMNPYTLFPSCGQKYLLFVKESSE